MYKVEDFYNAIDAAAPFCRTEGRDNVGILIGDGSVRVTKAIVALDATRAVIDEAVSIGANLIITHHPVIFHPLRNLLSDSRAYLLAAAGISVICAHTNLDMADGGVNDILAGLLGLKSARGCIAAENGGEEGLYIGRIGELETPMSPGDFALYVKERLNLAGLYYCGGNREINTVAVCSGDGTSGFIKAANEGADAYVTGESKHHILLEAAEKGVTYVAAGHFGTENIIVGPLADLLAKAMPGAAVLRSEACDGLVRFV